MLYLEFTIYFNAMEAVTATLHACPLPHRENNVVKEKHFLYQPQAKYSFSAQIQPIIHKCLMSMSPITSAPRPHPKVQKAVSESDIKTPLSQRGG
jgi:hypothetical protein